MRWKSSTTNAQSDSFRDSDRGQTLNDYAIGMSVFLMTVAFVFMQVPALMGPFTGAPDPGMTVKAQQTSSMLVENYLAGNQYSDQPSTLDEECTKAFFAGNDAASCPYNGEELTDAFGLQDHRSTRIVITNPSGSSVASLDGVSLERGDSLPDSANIESNSRLVQLNGEMYRLTVYHW